MKSRLGREGDSYAVSYLLEAYPLMNLISIMTLRS